MVEREDVELLVVAELHRSSISKGRGDGRVPLSVPSAPAFCWALLEWVTMSSGADLFVVCKQCGSEVSPYITECPYCGHRLRRRAPKLPRAQDLGGSSRASRRRWPRVGRFRSGLSPGFRRSRARGEDRWATWRPYATAVLVLVSCAAWVGWRGGFVGFDKLVIAGPLKGDWWKLFTSQFAYGNGLYEFVALVAIAIFGWLLERRHGPVVALAVFLGAGVTGALVASCGLRRAGGESGATVQPSACWRPGRSPIFGPPARAWTTRAISWASPPSPPCCWRCPSRGQKRAGWREWPVGRLAW